VSAGTAGRTLLVDGTHVEVITMDNEADQQLDDSRAMTRTRRRAGTRHTVASDDRLIEEIRAGRVPPDDPDPIAALLARWRLCGRPDS
jgi:hypothetical protein